MANPWPHNYPRAQKLPHTKTTTYKKFPKRIFTLPSRTVPTSHNFNDPHNQTFTAQVPVRYFFPRL